VSTKTVEPRGTRLLSFWEPPDEAGPPIGCVASTYTFDGPFFEEHCLGRFAGIESDPNEDRRAYLIEREEKLAQVYSCVLVDRAHVTPHRSLRWNLLPVSVPGGGIQHSKLALLVWERHVRLLVGSANLTEPGYRSNYEQMAALDFTPEGDLPRGLLEDAIAHLERTRSFVPEGVQRTAHPGQALREFLRRASRHVSSWADRGWAPGAVRAELLCVHPGSKSLLDQLAERTWSGTGADIVHAMSPFFDLGTGARTLLTKLLRIMSVQGERRIEFFVGGRRLPDGALELDAPESIREPAGKSVEHVFHLVHARDELGEPRALHAKSLWLQRGDRAVCAVGSSNFTTAGTGAGGGATNLEANVAYVLPPASRNAEWKSIAASWPEDDELDLARQDVRFQREPQDRTPEPCEFDALPLAFGLAVFTPSAEGSKLELSIHGEPPGAFRVLDFGSREIVTEAGWRADGAPPTVVDKWEDVRPPSALLVEWPSGDGHAIRKAVWVVNVSDGALLPPPSELMHLTLEELLEVLTSARPLHVAVGAVLDRRDSQATSRAEVVVDPHRKVDTTNFLVRRVRRVSQALEGMRERLERPAFTRDALAWRLHGPVGPLILARKLAEHEGQGAAFMIAEVALTLRHADLSSLERSLGREYVRASVDEVLAKLAELAAAHPAPENLSRYVGECFAWAKP